MKPLPTLLSVSCISPSFQTKDSQAGLNLNLVAAVSGIFRGSKTKTTDTDENGKSHSVEHSKGHGTMHGTGDANVGLIGSGTATTRERHRITEEAMQSRGTRQERLEQVDHLGIEGSK